MTSNFPALGNRPTTHDARKHPTMNHHKKDTKSVSKERYVSYVSRRLDRISEHGPVTWQDLLNKFLGVDDESYLSHNLALIGRVDKPNKPAEYSLIWNEKHFSAKLQDAQQCNGTFTIMFVFLKNVKVSIKDEREFIENMLNLKRSFLSVVVFQGTGWSTLSDKVQLSQMLTQAQSYASAMEKFLFQFKSCIEQSSIDGSVESLSQSVEMSSPTCGKCEKTISGIHYKCSICTNYYLCEMCELSSESIHDSSHCFLKIKNFTRSTLPENNVLESASLESSNSLSKELVVHNTPPPLASKSTKSDSHRFYSSGQKILKIWNIKNETNVTWDVSYTFRCIKTNINPEDGRLIIPVPALKPGEKGKINIFFKIPHNLNRVTIFETSWRFYANEVPFGKCFKLILSGKPDKTITEISESSKSTQTEQGEKVSSANALESKFNFEDVVFPPCFNMDIPFHYGPMPSKDKLVSKKPSKESMNQSSTSKGVPKTESARASKILEPGLYDIFFKLLSKV